MSATNRGDKKRHASDFYATPLETIKAFIPYLDLRYTYFDPCAGQGNFLLATPHLNWIGANELEEKHAPFLDKLNIDYYVSDFLNSVYPNMDRPDVIFSNPPYSLAQEFILKSLALAKKQVIFLLRLSFLESNKRHDFFQKHCPDVYVLSKRPSFTSDGKTDACAYAFFVFDVFEKSSGLIQVI